MAKLVTRLTKNPTMTANLWTHLPPCHPSQVAEARQTSGATSHAQPTCDCPLLPSTLRFRRPPLRKRFSLRLNTPIVMMYNARDVGGKKRSRRPLVLFVRPRGLLIQTPAGIREDDTRRRTPPTHTCADTWSQHTAG